MPQIPLSLEDVGTLRGLLRKAIVQAEKDQDYGAIHELTLVQRKIDNASPNGLQALPSEPTSGNSDEERYR